MFVTTTENETFLLSSPNTLLARTEQQEATRLKLAELIDSSWPILSSLPNRIFYVIRELVSAYKKSFGSASEILNQASTEELDEEDHESLGYALTDLQEAVYDVMEVITFLILWNIGDDSNLASDGLLEFCRETPGHETNIKILRVLSSIAPDYVDVLLEPTTLGSEDLMFLWEEVIGNDPVDIRVIMERVHTETEEIAPNHVYPSMEIE